MFEIHIHEDERYDEKYKWCPNCGANAFIVIWNSTLGKRYRCQCGLYGRFGSGLSEPTKDQPLIETY